MLHSGAWATCDPVGPMLNESVYGLPGNSESCPSELRESSNLYPADGVCYPCEPDPGSPTNVTICPGSVPPREKPPQNGWYLGNITNAGTNLSYFSFSDASCKQNAFNMGELALDVCSTMPYMPAGYSSRIIFAQAGEIDETGPMRKPPCER
jgi:hypothetical protein